MSELNKKQNIPTTECYTPKNLEILNEMDKIKNLSYPKSFILEKAETDSFNGPRCPEMQPLTGSIRACLDYMGENYGFVNLNGSRLDKGFIYICNLIGEAYTNDASRMYDKNTLANSLDGIKKLFHTLEYDFEIYTTDSNRSDFLPKNLMELHIKNHIYTKKRPIVTDGFWEVPMSYAAIGYEDEGNTLIGWNYHVFNFGPNPEPVIAKKSNWYEEATFFIFLGKKTKKIDEKELYHRIIRMAYHYLTDDASMNLFSELIRLLSQTEEECIAEAKSTHKIMGHDISSLDNNEAFGNEFVNRMVDPIWCCVSERRHYAANFFKLAKIILPEFSEQFTKIEDCFWTQSRQFGNEYIKEVGHSPIDREKFRDMNVRRRMADVVESTRKEEEKLILLIKKLLS